MTDNDGGMRRKRKEPVTGRFAGHGLEAAAGIEPAYTALQAAT
jgi:hypothetical protein